MTRAMELEGRKKHGLPLGGYNHIDMVKAMQLKLSALQVLLINCFIQNWIAGTMEPYDTIPGNILWRYNVSSLARAWNMAAQALSTALFRLTEIKEINGERIQLMFMKRTSTGIFAGMFRESIWVMVRDNPALFLSQCKYYNRIDLLEWSDTMMGKKKIENSPIAVKQIEDQEAVVIKHQKVPAWTEEIVKEICELAEKEKASVIKNDKEVKIFSHLKNGEFKSRRKCVDTACWLIHDLYTGQFWRNNLYVSGNIPKHVLELKKFDMARKRISGLKGSKEGIKYFLLKSAKNYFTAARPGMETYRQVKNAFPVSIDHFILHKSYNGAGIANFLLYHTAPITSEDAVLNTTLTRIENSGVPIDILNKFARYGEAVSGKQVFGYWLNVYRLIKLYKKLIADKKTSYQLASCFDMTFKRVDDTAARHNTLYAGYFDPEQMTIGETLKELRDK